MSETEADNTTIEEEPETYNPEDDPRFSAEAFAFAKMKSAEDLGRLRYEYAVELSRETNYQTFVRKCLKPCWRRVSGVVKDVWRIFYENIARYNIIYGRHVSHELIHLITDLVLFPRSVYETFRIRAYMYPFQGIYRYFADMSVYSHIKVNTLYSYNFAISVYNSRWTRIGKLYLGGLTLLSMYSIYHWGLRPWPLHNPKGEIKCLHKTVVITGSSSGIGYSAAYEFAKRGAFVIITSPDMVKARKARLDVSRRIQKYVSQLKYRYIDQADVRYYDQLEVPPTLNADFLLHNIVEMELNLASTASIYSFTRKIQGMSPQGIDILINNAAIHAPPEEMVVSDEGKEVHFAVNYFGHFILTNLLMGQLAKRKGSRIINVTCKSAAEQGFLNLAHFIEPYLEENGLPYLPAVNGYENSKLALFLFNRQLSKELQLSNINNVTTYCVCPGFTRSNIGRHLRDYTYHGRYWRHYITPFYKKDYHAVQTVLHCALSCKVANESGFFYQDNKRTILRTRHKDVDQIAQDLWTASLTLMGVGHNSMLKLTEQMHIRSHENIFQLASNLFLHRRDVMTHLLLMEEQHAHKNAHKKFIGQMGDAREDFTYFWHGFYLTGGNQSGLLERWVLYNTHPGFRELQQEYDIWFECSGSSHFYPQSNGKMASLMYMTSMPEPLTTEDIEELEELYESESEPDFEMEHKDRYHHDYIALDEYIT